MIILNIYFKKQTTLLIYYTALLKPIIINVRHISLTITPINNHSQKRCKKYTRKKASSLTLKKKMKHTKCFMTKQKLIKTLVAFERIKNRESNVLLYRPK